MPSRRALLGCIGAGAAASLGGCLDRFEAVAGDAPEPHGTRIVAVDPDSPPGLPVTPEVSIVDAGEKRNFAPSIMVTWTNAGRDSVRVGDRDALLFDYRRSVGGDAYLLGLEGSDRDDLTSYGGCHYVSETVGDDGEYRTTQIARQGQHMAMAGLYAGSEQCLESGTYRFETPVTVWNPPERDVQAVTERWGFDLQVETDSDS